MSGRRFVDTNILIYAHDLDADAKHERAAAVVRELWENDGGVISVQVLQEFYVNVTQKIPQPLPPAEARGLLQAYRAWRVEAPTATTVVQASEIQERNRLSFWDAMIIATAVQANADTLLTEDLNHTQLIEGIRIHNPLLPT